LVAAPVDLPTMRLKMRQEVYAVDVGTDQLHLTYDAIHRLNYTKKTDIRELSHEENA